MSKYFTMAEMIASDTAKKYKIDNTPNDDQKKHLDDLMLILDEIREKWGGSIKVTSGFRGPVLNKKIGGVSNSSHQNGDAADLQPVKGTPRELFCFIKGYLLGKKLKFGQLLMETSGKTAWVHFSIKDGETQRCQIKEINV